MSRNRSKTDADLAAAFPCPYRQPPRPAAGDRRADPESYHCLPCYGGGRVAGFYCARFDEPVAIRRFANGGGVRLCLPICPERPTEPG